MARRSSDLTQSTLLTDALVDVAADRERSRQRRLRKITFVLGFAAAWMWFRFLAGRPV